MTDFTQADVEWLAEHLRWKPTRFGSLYRRYGDNFTMASTTDGLHWYLTSAGAWEAMVWLLTLDDLKLPIIDFRANKQWPDRKPEFLFYFKGRGDKDTYTPENPDPIRAVEQAVIQVRESDD